MPLIVEIISTPSAQDLSDLGKIYADAPAWLLAPYADTAALVEAAAASGELLAGRFNDRLLGAARLQRGATHWRLSHLCVRGLTRQRGIARRLLDEAQRLATAAGQPLHLAGPREQAPCQALAAAAQLPLDDL